MNDKPDLIFVHKAPSLGAAIGMIHETFGLFIEGSIVIERPDIDFEPVQPIGLEFIDEQSRFTIDQFNYVSEKLEEKPPRRSGQKVGMFTNRGRK